MKIIIMPVAKLNAGDLNTAAINLIKTTNDNVADFPQPPLTDLTGHQTNLGLRLSEMASLKKEVTAKSLEIDAAAALVRSDMNDLGDWFEGVTKDPAKLSKVAQLRATNTPSGPTPRVTGLALSIGDKAGAIDGGWHSEYKNGVKSYEVQAMLNPLNNDPSTGAWTSQPTVTKSTTSLTGFTSGARVWVRVRAIGPSGTGEFCDPATIIVP